MSESAQENNSWQYSLFVRPRFLWGSVAATIATFALYGLLFVVPQYLQAVLGQDALGTGVRLLPLIGGLFVGAAAADRLIKWLGTTVPVTAGLLIVAGGLAVGSTTSVSDGYPLAATWLGLVGAGVGLALAPAMDAVLGELSTDRSSAGTALTMTLRQVGGAFGVALLGSVLSAGYTSRFDAAGLPEPLARAAEQSVIGAVTLAGQIGDATMAAAARSAYMQAMDFALIACAALALLGAALSAFRLPSRPASGAGTEESDHEFSRVA